MRFEDLTPEQQVKAKECKSAEEVIALAGQEGIDLSDEELEQISGGDLWVHPDTCVSCGRTGTVERSIYKGYHWFCTACGAKWD